MNKRLAEDICALLYFNESQIGMSHPAAEKVHQAFRVFPETAAALAEEVAADMTGVRVRFVECLRVVPVDAMGPWCYEFALKLLGDADMEMRDAAIGCLEHWGGPRALEILRGYHDPNEYLEKYVRAVEEDLERENPDA